MAGLPYGEALAQLGNVPDVARGVTVTSRQRSDYNPLGVRLGGFRLDGSVEAGGGWDSNIFGRKNSIKSDAYVDEAARINLESDWTRHAVGASVNMDARQYFKQSSQDWQDFDVGGFGRYDFSSSTNLQAQYRHYRDHLDVYSADVQSAGISQPVPYNSDEFVVAGTTRLNRLGLIAQGVYRTFDFENVPGLNTQVSRNSFNTTVGAIGASYSLAPGRNITTIVRVQDISYTANDPSVRARDSFTWEALTGFDYDFDGLWQGRIAVGWRQREYRGPNIRTLQGPAFEGSLSYVPTQLTTLRLLVSRTIEESIRQDAVSYQRTQLGLSVDHEYLRNVILHGEVKGDRREYERPSQRSTDALLILSARYLLNRNMQVIGSYAYTRRLESTGGFTEYDRNLLQVRLRFDL
ncbi:outer membrane beta-barrel protein [Belnapia sp. T6]|uniref:Outer membrane beta-barrel protein n=1 Tax=Belnapia mucosa TaxID=2804532 RepID=A0ABS1V2K9_9PROT|nr:outer membrane beta-barrel protein [Belnapia mucosa]MBL6455935.1 outer membrane beta-barrel protein [Belnapia mucosa]